MSKEFRNKVKISDVQEEFDKIKNDLNESIDKFNKNTEEIDFSIGGDKIAPRGYTMTVGNLKEMLKAAEGQVIGAKIFKIDDARVKVTNGIVITRQGLVNLPDSVVELRGRNYNSLFFNTSTQEYQWQPGKDTIEVLKDYNVDSNFEQNEQGTYDRPHIGGNQVQIDDCQWSDYYYSALTPPSFNGLVLDDKPPYVYSDEKYTFHRTGEAMGLVYYANPTPVQRVKINLNNTTYLTFPRLPLTPYWDVYPRIEIDLPDQPLLPFTLPFGGLMFGNLKQRTVYRNQEKPEIISLFDPHYSVAFYAYNNDPYHSQGVTFKDYNSYQGNTARMIEYTDPRYYIPQAAHPDKGVQLKASRTSKASAYMVGDYSQWQYGRVHADKVSIQFRRFNYSEVIEPGKDMETSNLFCVVDIHCVDPINDAHPYEPNFARDMKRWGINDFGQESYSIASTNTIRIMFDTNMYYSRLSEAPNICILGAYPYGYAYSSTAGDWPTDVEPYKVTINGQPIVTEQSKVTWYEPQGYGSNEGVYKVGDINRYRDSADIKTSLNIQIEGFSNNMIRIGDQDYHKGRHRSYLPPDTNKPYFFSAQEGGMDNSLFNRIRTYMFNDLVSYNEGPILHPNRHPHDWTQRNAFWSPANHLLLPKSVYWEDVYQIPDINNSVYFPLKIEPRLSDDS